MYFIAPFVDAFCPIKLLHLIFNKEIERILKNISVIVYIN